MEKLPSISVLGCGWFGFPMSKRLIQSGYCVKGSTTSPEKLKMLSDNEINAYLVQFPLNSFAEPAGNFFNCDILLLNIPPKGKPKVFLESISDIIKLTLIHKIKQLIFISSTSVFADTNSNITDNNETLPASESGKALLEAEMLLKSQSNFTTTIIRFAGLVGPHRHPGKFLAGKKNVSNGLAPINLIHQDDCIEIVYEVIKQKAFGTIFNACAPYHPTRMYFYKLAAKALGLQEPEFIKEKLNWKLIGSIYVPEQLNYNYKIKDEDSWQVFLNKTSC